MRMKGTRDGDDDMSDDENLVESARKLLNETENEEHDSSKAKGLFQMSFMQRGLEKQRAQAKSEARQLLMELEGNEETNFDDDFAAPKVKSKSKKLVDPASQHEMKHVLADGDIVAASLKFGKSDTVAVGGSIDIGLDDIASPKVDKGVTAASKYTTALSATQDEQAKKDTQKEHSAKGKRKKQKKTPISSSDNAGALEKGSSSVAKTASKGIKEAADNPWIEALDSKKDNDKGSTVGKKSQQLKRSAKEPGGVDIDAAVDLLGAQKEKQKNKVTQAVVPVATKVEKKANNKIHLLTQEELVKRAFSTLAEDEVDAEFAKEKAEVEDREDIVKKKVEEESKLVFGWGSWTGKGSKPPKAPKAYNEKTMPPEKKLKRKREDEKKPNVIISERRIKSLANSYMVAQIPHPYTSREEYERAMAGGLGREWNVTSSFTKLTQPKVLTHAGKIIQPLSKRVKRARPAAKF
jgi:U3 small nucleolar RNA-associated protein 14